jgi:hypothetical protein
MVAMMLFFRAASALGVVMSALKIVENVWRLETL